MKKLKLILLIFYIVCLCMWIHARFLDHWDPSKTHDDFKLNTGGQTQVIYIGYLGGFGMIYWNGYQEEKRFMFDGYKIHLNTLQNDTEKTFVANEHDKKIMYYLIERSGAWEKYGTLMRYRGYPIDYIRYYLFLPPTIFFTILIKYHSYLHKKKKKTTQRNKRINLIASIRFAHYLILDVLIII